MRKFVSVAVVAVLVVAGFALGVSAYASIDPRRYSIDPDTQGKVVLVVGALITALLAFVAAYTGGSLASRGSRQSAEIAAASARIEAEETRKEGRRQADLDRQRHLRTLIVAQCHRHAKDAEQRVARRQVLTAPQDSDPPLRPTIEIEAAVVELYTLGFQKTADIAAVLLEITEGLDAFTLDAAPLSLDRMTEFIRLRDTERQVRTEVMRVGLTDLGTDELKADGTLPPGYLEGLYRQVYGEAAPPQSGVIGPLFISGSYYTSGPRGGGR